MDSLPDIKEQAQKLFDEAKSHPEHRIGWRKRRDFYEILGNSLGTMGGKVRAWLVLLTAQRVLPLFEQQLPNVNIPRLTTEYSENYLLGKLSIESLQDWEAKASIAVGTLWGTAYGPKKQVLFAQTVLAGLAVAHIVSEITRGDPFTAIYLYSYRGPDGKSVSGDQWSDENLAKSLAGDTASSASIAEAYDPRQEKVNPVKLLTFWEWWLTDAIDEAWKKSTNI